jgi:hypothetical protein
MYDTHLRTPAKRDNGCASSAAKRDNGSALSPLSGTTARPHPPLSGITARPLSGTTARPYPPLSGTTARPYPPLSGTTARWDNKSGGARRRRRRVEESRRGLDERRILRGYPVSTRRASREYRRVPREYRRVPREYRRVPREYLHGRRILCAVDRSVDPGADVGGDGEPILTFHINLILIIHWRRPGRPIARAGHASEGGDRG